MISRKCDLNLTVDLVKYLADFNWLQKEPSVFRELQLSR